MKKSASVAKENYLKAIYKIQQDEGLATNQAIAEHLDSTPAAVTGMLRKLMDDGSVNYEAYQGAILTEAGEHVAVSTIRKHRLWEVFLVDKLKFGWEDVHHWAEELEHIGDVNFTNRLDHFLGCPQTDPHGDPIPDEHGHFSKAEVTIPSSKAEVGQRIQIKGVIDSQTKFLKHLDELGIALGMCFLVSKHFDFDGSFEWIVEGNEEAVMVSNPTAENLMVRIV